MSAATAAPPALELRDISGGYGHTTVLRGVNLTVPAASVTALLGPNGAGKTTLLKTVSGLLRPTSGVGRDRRRGRHQAQPRLAAPPAACATSRRVAASSAA